jgi:GntR family transcriptional regulator
MPAEPESEQPIYQQIARALEARIVSGALKPGEQLPSERQLSEELGASRMTVRQALRILSSKGLIETRTGSGTFVGHRRIEQQLSALNGFTEAMNRRGLKTSSIVLGASTVPAEEAIASALGIADRSPVHRLIRVRLVDGEPVAMETTEIPALYVPDLLERADYATTSLYGVLRKQGLSPTDAEQSLTAGHPDRATALALQITETTPVLKLTRRTFDQHRRPIEFVRSTYRGDTFVMSVHLSLGN